VRRAFAELLDAGLGRSACSGARPPRGHGCAEQLKVEKRLKAVDRESRPAGMPWGQ
jgi:hypothetical protein